MILTNEEIVGAVQGTGSTKLLMTIALRIEAAVLEKLKQQEPVYQVQRPDGGWIDQPKGSYEYNKANGWAVRAIYAAPVPAVLPEGWKLVPVEPTPEMLGAGLRHVAGMASMPSAYRAMISAAPAAPSVEAEQ